MKKIIIASVAFLLGGFVGYKVCERTLAKAYRQDLESVIQRMTRYDTKEIEEKETEAPPIIFTKSKTQDEPEKKVDYSKFSKPSLFDYARDIEKENQDEEDEEESEESKDEEDDDDDEYNEFTEDFPEDEENEYEPYVILEEQYYDSMNNNGDDGQLLFYYTKDQVVCEEDDSIVDDYYKILGYDFEDMLETDSVVWVRNANLRTVYEIHRMDQAYSDTIANLVETPKERELRRVGRVKQVMDR